MNRLFVIEIEILTSAYFIDRKSDAIYKKGMTVMVPIRAKGRDKALAKLHRTYCGDTYPQYNVLRVSECDDFIFRPLM